jgi:hypothetical protein
MRTTAGLPFLLLGLACAPAQAQIYKCLEEVGAILYTDQPCNDDMKTVAVMARGSTEFNPEMRADALVAQDLSLLSQQEAQLARELEEAQAAPGESLREMPEAHALRMEILAKLKSVRRQKFALLGRGVSKKDNEELVMEPEE